MTLVSTTPVRNIISNTLHSRAAQFFAAIWIISAVLMLINGYSPLMGLAQLVGILIFAVITVIYIEPNPHTTETNPAERRKLYIQLALIGLIILLTALGGMIFHGLVPNDTSIPLWTPLMDAVGRFSGQTFGNDNYLANPLQYFVIPLILLLLLGAKLPELGLGRGHRVLRVTLIWCAIPVLAIIYLIISGRALAQVVQTLISNALQNGFFEEFLFRGALQTRLRRLTSPAWALVIQALVFGVWHIGLGYSNYSDPGGLITALASTVIYQAVLGLAFGIIFERSRNLFASSLFHVLYNSMFG